MDVELADLQALVVLSRDSDRVPLVRRFIEAVPPAFGKHNRAARTAK